MVQARFRLSDLRFQPATPSRWAAIEQLFGQRGACGGCWCMAWRLGRKEWEAGRGDANRRALRRSVEGGEKPGVLAFHGREPIGWCAVAPREAYPRLARSRVLKPVDEKPVWSITCLFIARPYRRRGVSARLLRAATDLAARRGATLVEGYPSEPYSANDPAAFLWTGIPSAFRKAGFREVARRSRARPILRKRVRKR